jgi:hypothetical protein
LVGVPLLKVKEVTEANLDCRRDALLRITREAAVALVRERLLLVGEGKKLSNDIEAIPPAEILDSVLRANAAAERNLNRAMDRLERLQRRRLGEAVPPLVSVRSTR